MKDILYRIYQNPRKMKMLKIVNDVCACFSAAFFGILLVLELLDEEYIDACILGGTAMIGFIFVTVLRALLDKPRPYEVYDFYEIKPGEREGKSFPSRHSFSAFVIATLSIAMNPLSAIAVYFMAIVIVVCRVFTGMHFIRDVVVGALIGILFGGVGILLQYLF